VGTTKDIREAVEAELKFDPRKHSDLPGGVLGHGGLVLVEVTIGPPSGGLRAGGGGCGEDSCSWPFPLMISPWWLSCRNC
jgi:hypothetical protein